MGSEVRTVYFNAAYRQICRRKTALFSEMPPVFTPLLGYVFSSILVSSVGIPSVTVLQMAGITIFVLLVWCRRPTRPLVIATAILWGGIATSIALTPAPYHLKLLQQLEGQEVTLAGKVLRVETQPGRWRLDVAVDTIYKGEAHTEARSMPVRIHVANETIKIYPGDHVRLRSKLSQPRLFGTPGEFNYPRYLARQGIVASGFVANAAAIARMAPVTPPSSGARIARWRQRTAQNIATCLPEQSTAYLLSLALGENTRLSPTQRQTLAFTGLSHLFSISGLHMGMIATLTYALLQFWYRRSTTLLLWQPVQKITPLMCLPIVFTYLILTGSALPTVRAGVMLGVAALVAATNYRTQAGAVLVLAAAFILLADPLALQTASFQLSFAGVGALLLVLPVWHRRLSVGWKRWIVLLVLTSYTAFLATTPFALWHFNTLAPGAILINILAVPLVSFIILPLTLSSTAIFSMVPTLGEPLLRFCATLLMQLLKWGEALAQGPLAGRYIYLSMEEHTALALLCAGLIFWAASRRIAAYTSFGGAIAALLLTLTPLNSPSTLRLTALSVGQGDSFLLQTPENRNYLIDGGGLYSDTFDTGAQLVAPALQRLGVTHLDAVILSHDHPDHSKGLNHILSHFPTRVFLSGAQMHTLNPHLRATLNTPQAPALIPLPEGLIRLDSYVYLHIPDQTHRSVNERSIAVFAGHGSEGLVLTGDLETAGMTQLMRIKPPFPVTLFKLPHHGSRNSRPEQWNDVWDIKHTIASCGFENHFGFPHLLVRDILAAKKIPLWRTDLHGSVQFSTDGKSWKVKHWRALQTPP
ncbi:MAG: DNA internalization-related competence protein ComEC/Rec2 [Desulfuromonadaceae bacterium]|nr:DNA internalization-related competence protein ComEC/Rec2 [Desulfuromonadaceae bacterium]